MNTNSIFFDNVSFTYLSNSEATINNFTASVPQGKITLLLGPSGSGKTTICNLATGITPSLIPGRMFGSVYVEGKNTRTTSVRQFAKIIGRVFQNPEAMFALLRVEEEIAFGLENLCIPTNVMHKKVKKALIGYGLEKFKDSYHWELSGGELQKLSLACISVLSPAIYVFDDPTAHLDPISAHTILDNIRRLKREGRTILLVTQKFNNIIADTDHCIIINGGKKILEGSNEEVLIESNLKLLKDIGVGIPAASIKFNDASDKEFSKITPTIHKNKNRSKLSTVQEQYSKFRNGSGDKPDSHTLLSIKNVCYSYNNEKNILYKISLDIKQGEIIGLLGQNGAGKSTLAKILSGHILKVNGNIIFEDIKITDRRRKLLTENIKLVLQDPKNQLICTTVLEELLVSIQCDPTLSQSTDKQQKKAKNLLKSVGLTDQMNSHPFRLSTGEQRRLAIISTIIQSKKMVILDEPTFGQDSQTIQWLKKILFDLNDEGITVLLISQEIQFVLDVVKRVLIMANGQITYDGNTSNISSEDLSQSGLIDPSI